MLIRQFLCYSRIGPIIASANFFLPSGIFIQRDTITFFLEALYHFTIDKKTYLTISVAIDNSFQILISTAPVLCFDPVHHVLS